MHWKAILFSSSVTCFCTCPHIPVCHVSTAETTWTNSLHSSLLWPWPPWFPVHSFIFSVCYRKCWTTMRNFFLMRTLPRIILQVRIVCGRNLCVDEKPWRNQCRTKITVHPIAKWHYFRSHWFHKLGKMPWNLPSDGSISEI